MLYHPCANQLEVNRLRYLVVNCLRRHVITPLALLDEERVRYKWCARGFWTGVI